MLIFTPKYFFHTFGSETGVKSPTMSYMNIHNPNPNPNPKSLTPP